MTKLVVEGTELVEYAGEMSRMYYVEKRSYAEIGRIMGDRLRPGVKEPHRAFAGESVRQVLDKRMPDRESGREFRARENERKRTEKLLAELLERLEEAVLCAIPSCGCWVIRRTGYRQRQDGREVKRTCSPECSKLWSDTRYKLDPEARDRQRRSLAKGILKKPTGKTAAELQWAKRMLSSNPPPPDRQYSQPGSKASEALERAVAGVVEEVLVAS